MNHPLPGPALPGPAFALCLDAAGRVTAADPAARHLFGDCLGAPPPVPCPAPGTSLDWTGAGGVWRLWTEAEPDGTVVLRGLDVADLAASAVAGEIRLRQFADLIDGATEGVAVAAGGRLVYVNPFMERLTGYDAATLRAKPFVEFLHPDDRRTVLGIHLRRLAGGQAPQGHAFRIVRADGGLRHVNAASAWMEWEGRPATVSFLADISELKAAEAALAEHVRGQEDVIAARTASLRETNDRLAAEAARHERTAQKLKTARTKLARALRAKSVFLANVSHEIRTPLNVILGMADLALRPDSGGQADLTRCLEMIREAGTSLRGILGDLLDLSRVESGRLELDAAPFSPRQVLEATLAAHRHVAQRQGLTLTGAAAADVPEHVIGDAGRLAQVLGNLVGNALKFTSVGGVSLRLTLARPGRCAPDGRVNLRFAVRDTGIGIPEDKQKTIFESFSQADETIGRRYGGTGLGLAICRRLATLMDGRLRLASAVGEGSEFVLTARFPLAEGPAEPASGPRPKLPPLDILLAEDADLAAEMIMAFLVPKGHNVIRVVNGEEALAALALRRFDLVLMDIQMPVMDGLTATRRIRSGELAGIPRDIPILALTAYGAVRDRERILGSGASGYLAKPVNFDQLLDALAASQSPAPARPPRAEAEPAANTAEAPDQRDDTPVAKPRAPKSRAKAGATAASARSKATPGKAQARTDDAAEPAFDAGRDEALANLGGDEELYARLIAVFLRDTPGDRVRLAAALDSSDASAVSLLAHSLKGNAGVVGATTAVARARELEHAARAGETARFAACSQALDAALDAALAGFAAKGHQPAAP